MNHTPTKPERHDHARARNPKAAASVARQPQEWPLVAVVLYGYNEERFVAEAVESLLTQDYPTLEIVLSDDGSSDATGDIMERMAAEWEGPHRVWVNRNPHNIGIGSQINAAVANTTAKLIVLANADDRSHPDRVRHTAAAWQDGDTATAVWSALRQVDAAGRPSGTLRACRAETACLARAARQRFGGPQAASMALDRRVFEAFGPLPDNLILEDNPLFARALLLGPVRHLEEPLVDYRVHGDNISQAYAAAPFDEWRQRHRQRVGWHRHEGVKAYIEILRDQHQAPAAHWPHDDLARARWTGMEKLLENAILRDYYTGDDTVSAATRLASLARVAWTIVRTRIKHRLPFIERRNDRWHYRRVLHANREQG